MAPERILDGHKAARRKPARKAPDRQQKHGSTVDRAGVLLKLQRQVGNRVVQRMVAQRSGDGAFELDEATSNRINQARGGGQALDGAVQKQMGTAMGHDFSGVRVHTSSEANDLNQNLSARAFTTGQDIFFKEGEYNPGSGGGQELIAHELTHVVQQGSGAVGDSGGPMTVNPPGDVYEQEADAVAKQAVSPVAEAVQRQTVEDEMPEDQEELQMKAIQRQTVEDEMPEDQEELQMKTIQRQTVEDEMPEDQEELQMKAIQKQDELAQDEEI